MTPLATAPDFEPALDDIQDHLPDWWATRNTSSELYKLLEALAAGIDSLSPLWQQPFEDQVLETASSEGLLRNFMFAWGLTDDAAQFLANPSVLVAYIQALATNDESLGGMLAVLTSLVNTPINTTGGTVLTFPSGGGGLTFPANGSGLPLYQFTPGNGPSAAIGLIFPADGSGLLFPSYSTAIADDNVIVNDGTTPLGAGPGLTFASSQFIELVPDYVHSTMTVKVLNWLTFDRGQFSRAVKRLQDAGWFSTVIVEVPHF